MFTIALAREEDGRWIAEVEESPGALWYGATPEEAKRGAVVIALNALAGRVHRGVTSPEEAGLVKSVTMQG